MNFLAATLAEGGRAAALKAGPTLRFADGPRPGADGRPLVIGIRPEHVPLAADGLPLALDLVEPLGSETVAHFAVTFQGLVTGQLRESLGCPPGGDEVEHYMNVIREKTGVLIAAAGRLGALHAGADRAVIEALHTVQHEFQDVIDTTSHTHQGEWCLEAVFCRGSAARVRELVYRLRDFDAVGRVKVLMLHER